MNSIYVIGAFALVVIALVAVALADSGAVRRRRRAGDGYDESDEQGGWSFGGSTEYDADNRFGDD